MKKHSVIMLAQATNLFTPAEAAVLTRLTVKAVNNAIDRKTVTSVSSNKAGTATRLLDLRALMSLTLERRLADRFVPELRREVFDALGTTSGTTISLDGGLLRIDLRGPRRELAASLRALRRARQLVCSDPGIMGGDPVFRSTRIPVHLVANLLRQGSTETELLEGYPRLTVAMIHAASIYAEAYPLRGRPRSSDGQKQTRRIRRKLATIAAE